MKFILDDYMRTTLLHMYHSHAFVPQKFCFCVLYESVEASLRELVCVVDIIGVQASSRASTISTLVLL